MPASTSNTLKWIQIISSLLLLVSFFLPWVNWDGSEVSGMAMATGDFFKTAESRFELSNPFPQLSILFNAFWLIPLLALVLAGLVFVKNKSVPLAFILGSMSLGLLTIYYLFTGILIDLGAGNSVIGMLKPWFFIHGLAAVVLILTAFPVKQPGWKIGWLLLGPVLAFTSFKIGEKQVMGQTHKETKDVKADYSVTAGSILKEFIENDTASNRKYLDKVVEVRGMGPEIEIQADSTSNLKFADSTGNYLVFSLEKDQFESVKKIQPGSDLTLKGVCSGSIYSEILGTRSISFKRSAIKTIK